MEVFASLSEGFDIALTWDNLLFCFIGVTIGTFVGVLPGIGALATISLALPLTFHLDTMAALIMLSGIFYGAQYGSSTASILLNLPGTATAVVACIDGYPMARQGRAGVALFVTAITSFIGGAVGIILLMTAAPVIARAALGFGAPEYFTIMLLGLVAASSLSVGSPLKGYVMILIGIALGFVGVDANSGQMRFAFGNHNLAEGLGLVAIAMGLFGVSELLASIGTTRAANPPGGITFRSMLPSREDVRRSGGPTARGSLVGFVIGALPGAGPSIASFLAYALETRVSRTPERFGKGAVEGIAAPEAANNAAVQSAFIPTLSLGIPGDAVMAVLLGALMIHGIAPGPHFIADQPEMFWGLIASFWIGNLLLLVLNIPLIGLWVRILTIPYHILYPVILMLVCFGVFSVRNNMTDVYIMLGAGVAGYFLRIYGYPAAPVLLGFILGPLMEEHFRRSLLMARGDITVFFDRPISAILLAITAFIIIIPMVGWIRRKRARQLAPH
jgi:putative tricarboxylic transport membrane protein